MGSFFSMTVVDCNVAKSFLVVHFHGEISEEMTDEHYMSVGLTEVLHGRKNRFFPMGKKMGNPKTLTPGPRTLTTGRVRGLPTDRSADYSYGPLYRPPPKLTEIKISLTSCLWQ